MSDAGAERCPASTTSPALNYKDTERCVTCRGPLCTSRVTSISTPLPKGVAGSRAGPHTSLSASPPSHATVMLQNTAARDDEEGRFPLPRRRTTCSHVVVLLRRGKFHSRPNAFSFFSVSHRALKRCRRREPLEPWQARCRCSSSNYRPAEGSRLPFPFPWK